MSADLLARAAAAGLWLWLEGGKVRWRARRPPPSGVLEELRANREAIAAALAADLSSHPSLLSQRGCAFAPPVAQSPGAPPEPGRGPDDAEEAEREAIRAEPVLPPEGSPERDRLDRMQRRMQRGLLDAAMRRPPAWSDPGAPPTPGCRCVRCCGGRWWCEAGEAPRGWRCRTCHPPDHLPADAVREVRT